MEATTNIAPINTTPTPNAAPTSQVAAPAPTTPIAPETTPIMADGGEMDNGGGIKGFFKSLNWIEVGFSILGVAALTYVIHYYRFKLRQDKMINNELQRQIDEVKMNVQTAMKGKYKSI
jgi:hypothetical protein